MEYNKNQRFSVGDRVIALTDPAEPYPYCQPRNMGQEYTVEAIIYCSKCGIQSINIGPVVDKWFDVAIGDCDCGHELNAGMIYWTYSYLFAPVQELDKLIEELLKVEDYETATIIRDFQKKQL